MPKNSEDYWREREEEQRKHNITNEREYRKNLERIYKNMLSEVSDQIYSFYAKYANKEGISMAEAKRRANKLDIVAYAEKAKKYVKEKDFSDQANEEMRIYNLTMKVNRLELLKAQIGLELCAGSDEIEKFMTEQLEDRTLAEIERQAGILGKSIQNNKEFAKAIVNASFHNATFSDRIWAEQASLRSQLSTILQNALIAGRHPRDFIPQIRKIFDVTKSQANRLLVTEMARVQTEAQMQSFKRNGFDEYTFLALGTACEVCRKIDGHHFKVEKANAGVNMPPMHPHCRCSASAYMDDEEYEAWLNSYKDHGLTWDEWKNAVHQQYYRKIVKGEEIQKFEYDSKQILNTKKVVTYIEDDVYLSSGAKIKPRSLHKMVSQSKEAMKSLGINNKKLTYVIYNPSEIPTALGKFDAIKNTVFYSTDILSKNTSSKPSRKHKVSDVIFHEMVHKKQAEIFEENNSKITDENYEDYIRYSCKKAKKFLDSIVAEGYDIYGISNYANKNILFGRFDEVEAEYKTKERKG